MSRFGMFTINEVAYDLDDLTLADAEEIEDLGGAPLGELNYGSAKVMKAIVRVLLKRTNPEVTDAEVGAIKLISFVDADEKMPALPPDEGDAPESQTTNGSALGDSGAQLSVASTAG